MTSSKTAKEAVLFAIVGLAASALHFLIAISLIERLGITAWLANLGAFAAAFPISLIGHALFTFKAADYGRDHWVTQAATRRFFMVTCLGGLIIEAGVIVFAEILGAPHRIVIGGMIVFSATATFLLGKFWAFRGRSPGV